jgi:hypothetical protein
MPIRRVVSVCVLIAMCGALLGAADDPPVSVKYRLPKSVLVVKGTIASKMVFKSTGGMEAKSEPTGVSATLVTSTEASTRDLVLEASALAKTDTKVTLTEQGGLTGLTRVSEGQLGTIIKNIFGTIVSVAALASGVPIAATDPAEDQYQDEFAERAALRRETRANIALTVKQMVALGASLANESDPAKVKPMRERLEVLDRSLKLLRREGDLQDTHFSTWKTRKEAASEQAVEYVVDVDDLPADSVFPSGVPIDPNKLTEAAKALATITKQLRIVITRVEPEPTPGPDGKPVPPPTYGNDVVVFRDVRPVVLRLYQVGADNKLVHVRESQEYIVGHRSALRALPLPTTKFSKRSVEAQWTGVSLTKVGFEASAKAGDIAEAIRQGPAELLSALKQANEIETERRKLSLVNLDRKLEQVKKEKEYEETRIALGQALNLEEAKSKLADLEIQVKTLEAQRLVTIGGAVGTASNGQFESMNAQQQLLKLQNELLKAQVEQLELQAKLAAATAGSK